MSQTPNEPRPAGHEDRATRLKRMRMRMTHRGIKEMDIILSRYADVMLERLSQQELDELEMLMEENDQYLYAWIAGSAPAPQKHQGILESIRKVAFGDGERFSPPSG